MRLVIQARYFLSHYLNEVNQHSLHTPFLYDLYTKVFKSDKLDGDYSEIETIRASMVNSKDMVELNGLGAGSKVTASYKRSISDIVKSGNTPKKYSELFYRLVKYFNVRKVIELGTSAGINTLYLSKYEATKVYTFEGEPELIKVAKYNFDQYKARNIKIIEGDIDHTLSSFLDGSIKPDLVYIDANHRYGSTMRYIQLIIRNKHKDTVVIIDDIHWSREMHRAWQTISNIPEVTLSLDLFQCGILFFKPEFTKQHFILNY